MFDRDSVTNSDLRKLYCDACRHDDLSLAATCLVALDDVEDLARMVSDLEDAAVEPNADPTYARYAKALDLARSGLSKSAAADRCIDVLAWRSRE